MCIIVTIIMLILSIQNLIAHHWLNGGVQLLIALVFLFLLISNIRQVQARSAGSCTDGCKLTDWAKKFFRKRDS